MPQHIRSVFLYGTPTKNKLNALVRMQNAYTDLVNKLIEALVQEPSCYLALLNNNRFAPEVNRIEANLRTELGAAIGQSALGHAVKELHNHFTRIRHYLYGYFQAQGDISIFASSVALLNASLLGLDPKETLTDLLQKNRAGAENRPFYERMLATLDKYSDAEIQDMMGTVARCFREEAARRKIPFVKSAPIQLDTRVAKLEKATHIQADYVLRMKVLGEKRWIEIPLRGSRNGIRRLEQYGVCSPSIRVRADGTVRVAVPFTKKVKFQKPKETIGIDVGITHLIHTSHGKTYGTFSGKVEQFEQTVMAKEQNRSKLRNLMRCYQKELHKPGTPEGKKAYLRKKIANINHMLQGQKKLERRKRSYRHAVRREISLASKQLFADIKGQPVQIAVEDLCIMRFDQSRKQNQRNSMWARGVLLEKIEAICNWHGIGVVKVDPAFTSQMCPKCYHIDPENRNGKSFRCTVCNHKDDADHNGSVNIRERASDMEVQAIVEAYRYNTELRHAKLKELYAERHKRWKNTVAAA